MKRVVQFVCLAIVALYFLPSLAYSQTTYYVRADGGTAAQCTGTTNAPYTGSGSNQACAYNHPFWLVTSLSGGSTSSPGAWKIAGGDKVIIADNATYEIGPSAPNASTLCGGNTLDCHLPSPPAGTSGSYTLIAGINYNSGCASRPTFEIDGSPTEEIIELNPKDQNGNTTQFVQIDCIEMRGWQLAGGNSANNGKFGIKYRNGWGVASPIATNIRLNNLYIHGFSSAGILGRYSNVTSTNLRLSRNGSSGWNIDLGDNLGSLNFGTWTLNNLIVEYNGCQETASLAPTNCTDDNHAGYGDGIAMPGTSNPDSTVNATFNNPIIRYNTQDGIDFLHCAQGCSLTVNGGLFYGNAGNQLKGSGSFLRYTNNIIISNCAVWKQAPLVNELCPGCAGNFDWCRANGDAVLMESYDGGTAQFLNNVVTGQGAYALDEGCRLSCSSPSYTIENNIFYGDSQACGGCQAGSPLNTIYNATGAQNENHNIWFNMINCVNGSGDLCSDPKLANFSDSESMDAHLQSGSPAIGAGANDGVTTDFAGSARPQGKGWDIGAYQFGGSGAPTPTKPNPASNLKVVVQ